MGKASVANSGILNRYRIEELCVTMLKWLLCLLFWGLLGMNLLCFSNLKNNAESVEFILGISFEKILCCVVILAGIYGLYHSSFFEKLDRKKLENALLLFITIGSVLWIFMAYDITQYDSHSILDAAEKFIDGDYSPLAAKSSYLQRYPFQLPFVFCAEQIYKITGPGRYMLIRLINVCFLYGIYKCLLKICNFILSGETEKKLAILLLCGAWQPVFLSTFIYPLIPSVFFSLFAACEFFTYFSEGNRRNVVFSGISLGMAILLKSNAWINYIAFGIIIALAIARGEKRQIEGALLISAALAILGQNAIYIYYEKQSGYQIEGGAPKVLWLAMGLQEGSKAPGWNNGFNWDTLKSVDFDAKQAADIGKEAVKEALNNFIEQPTYAIKFFGKKEISQWCEPTYECFNASYHREHEKPMGNLAKSIYVGTAHKLLLFYFHCYQIISILGILLYCLNVKNVIKVEQLLIPLTILGGFLFHTFMEGKSSYVFPYYIMMIPFSIKGILDLFSAIRGGKMEKKGYEQ